MTSLRSATVDKSEGRPGSGRIRPGYEPSARVPCQEKNRPASNSLSLLLPSDANAIQPVRAIRREVQTKQVICSKGDPGSHLFVVVTGRVKIAIPSEDGREITLGILESGETFGEAAVLGGGAHAATATAMERTELAVIDRPEFLRFLDREPAAARALMTTLCARLNSATELAEDLSFLPLPRRLAKTLLSLGRTYGKQTPHGLQIGLHLCQQELANLVGTSRESINKQLGAWQAEGLIGMEHGLITLRRLSG